MAPQEAREGHTFSGSMLLQAHKEIVQLRMCLWEVRETMLRLKSWS